MANEEVVLGPRKTLFVLVIVVGCFAVLWPRILSPLVAGGGRETLKPNQFDREAGCCEVIFSTEVAILELLNEVCSSAVGADGRLSPYAAAQCRQSVNETCGVDIAAFLKRSDNVGKTTKMLLETMRSTNSSCLREHYGVPVWSVSHHLTLNSWIKEDTVKQERSPIRGASPHPALRERGRAIPAGAPTPPSRVPVPLPAHMRPPPIPGMRPPLGSPGGPAPAQKSSMGFVMPIYTICIVVFFVYTLSKILFKRTGNMPYEELTPDPQFRRRVFRDDSRSTPDKKLVVTAISGLVAEVQQQMEASYAQSQQRQDVQDNHSNARPYTNGNIRNETPIRIIATEYREPSLEPSLEVKEPTPEPKEPTPEPKEPTPEPKEPTLEPKEPSPEPKEPSPELKEPTSELEEEVEEEVEPKEATPEKEVLKPKESSLESEKVTSHKGQNGNAVKLASEDSEDETEVKKLTEGFLNEARNTVQKEVEEKKQTTPELLEEALKEDTEEEIEEEEVEEEEEEEEEDDAVPEQSVKVMGMETTAHTADGRAWRAPPPAPAPPPRPPHEPKDVKSIYLETAIPQQSKVLVTDFAQERPRPPPTKHSPAVVSGKMTLSLIQDVPRDTPERDPESTFDEFTTASTVTQPAAEQKQDDLSEDEEEEIEIEEIEEEVEEEEGDDEGDDEREAEGQKK